MQIGLIGLGRMGSHMAARLQHGGHRCVVYKDSFGTRPSTGYETLLYDALIGEPTLFHRIDIVEAGWTVVEPILAAWREDPPGDFPNYAAGTWGPADAATLIERDGRQWRP